MSDAARRQASDAEILDLPIDQLLERHPIARDFFGEVRLPEPDAHLTPRAFFATLDDFQLADCGQSATELEEYLCAYVRRMEALSSRRQAKVGSLTIKGGTDKSGSPEQLDLTVEAGEITCIVGPTGSGKSRLLEDIEFLAQADTPTGRRVLLDGEPPSPRIRYAVEDKLVAQLSQSMVFVMDLSVRDFLQLHAESRMMPADSIAPTIEQALVCANGLAGEPFSATTSLTQLSGGQSRALMIADMALISASPIVLIDEIENAGVDRQEALDLLVGQDKIVFVVTHDPLIALMGTRRLVISNGAVSRIIEPSDQERANAAALHDLDRGLMDLRRRVRAGEAIDCDVRADMRRVLDFPAGPDT